MADDRIVSILIKFGLDDAAARKAAGELDNLGKKGQHAFTPTFRGIKDTNKALRELRVGTTLMATQFSALSAMSSALFTPMTIAIGGAIFLWRLMKQEIEANKQKLDALGLAAATAGTDMQGALLKAKDAVMASKKAWGEWQKSMEDAFQAHQKNTDAEITKLKQQLQIQQNILAAEKQAALERVNIAQAQGLPAAQAAIQRAQIEQRFGKIGSAATLAESQAEIGKRETRAGEVFYGLRMAQRDLTEKQKASEDAKKRAGALANADDYAKAQALLGDKQKLVEAAAARARIGAYEKEQQRQKAYQEKLAKWAGEHPDLAAQGINLAAVPQTPSTVKKPALSDFAKVADLHHAQKVVQAWKQIPDFDKAVSDAKAKVKALADEFESLSDAIESGKRDLAGQQAVARIQGSTANLGVQEAILKTPAGQMVSQAASTARHLIAGQPVSAEAAAYVRQLEHMLSGQNMTLKAAASALVESTRNWKQTLRTIQQVQQEVRNMQARTRNGP